MNGPTASKPPSAGAADAQAAPLLSDAEFELFRELMYETAGIHLPPGKRALVAGRLSKRLRELGHSSYREYFNWISRSSGDPQVRAERQTAIDLLTTNETYFFREERHFDLLRDRIVAEWEAKPVRLWSAACSTGQEAFTLAMVLAEHARGPWEILGTDVSTRVVRTAQHGIYPMDQAKNIPKRYLHACCLKGVGNRAGTFRIDRPLRDRVHFSHANLQEELSRLGEFDLIMLRNVLIYFDQRSKHLVVTNVLRQLKPGGWLMVGHAESLSGMSEGLQLVQPSVYRKQVAA